MTKTMVLTAVYPNTPRHSVAPRTPGRKEITRRDHLISLEYLEPDPEEPIAIEARELAIDAPRIGFPNLEPITAPTTGATPETMVPMEPALAARCSIIVPTWETESVG